MHTQALLGQEDICHYCIGHQKLLSKQIVVVCFKGLLLNAQRMLVKDQTQLFGLFLKIYGCWDFIKTLQNISRTKLKIQDDQLFIDQGLVGGLERMR